VARLAALAAANGVLAVVAGTSGAHLVTDPTPARWLMIAAVFGLGHAAAAWAVLALLPGPAGRWAAGLFGLGALIFQSTLVAMAFGAPRWLGAVTPAGGTLMLFGWVVALGGLLWLSRPRPPG
jgi:uncharacterized membrane protein YgdD (TMEM256/DUF423 family)